MTRQAISLLWLVAGGLYVTPRVQAQPTLYTVLSSTDWADPGLANNLGIVESHLILPDAALIDSLENLWLDTASAPCVTIDLADGTSVEVEFVSAASCSTVALEDP